eukprot:g41911.t1
MFAVFLWQQTVYLVSMGGSLASVMVWAVHANFFGSLWSGTEQLEYQAIMHPDNGASVEVGEEPYGRAKFPEPPEEEALLFSTATSTWEVQDSELVDGVRSEFGNIVV